MLRSALIISAASVLIAAQAQIELPYTFVPGDPMETRIYTLENGLQVWLSRNTDAPRIQTNIATRAGSKNDPADATGLAHYLEHMLFKGTSRIGTADWAKESVLLEQISDAYEERRKTTDDAERERIYHRIDSLSTLAAGYAVPNEYSKMTKILGARGTNAYTSTERTVYVNDIASDDLERWMMIESERMQECVLRLFHTELETVYEEFNRAQDNDGRTASAKMNALLYPNHPYGTQTTLGSGEHLKNPSMEKIHTFFDTYYVPNNMAVVLAGDLDYDKTIALVHKYFGGWKRKEVPTFTFKKEAPITTPITAEVFGPDAEWVDLAWRFDGYGSEDAVMLQLISRIISNGRAGVMDLDLIQGQKVLEASCYASVQTDYTEFDMEGTPKEGQTLEQVRDLLLAQLETVKNGAFDDWLIEAVVNDLKQNLIRSWSDNNSARVRALTDAFILRKDWKDVVNLYDRMGRITKDQVMAYANKNFSTNYVCVYKRTGENKDSHKVTKPKITAIDIKRDGKSAWRTEWEKVPSLPMEPEFVDFNTAIVRRDLDHGVSLACVKNPTTDLFSLRYMLDMGTDNDRELRVAVEYLPYLGTNRYSPEEFKKELFKIGVSLQVFTSEDRVSVMLTGLEKNLPKGLELLEHLLADARPNEEALRGLVADIRKSRQDMVKEKGAIMAGLDNYARYGATSAFNDVLTNDQLAALKGQALVDKIHALTSYKHKAIYYGKKSADEVALLLNLVHKTPATLKDYPAPRVYPELPTTENKVYFAEHDMVQTEMGLVSKAGTFDAGKLPYASLFNEYFGSGLSSIVFQEIREAKALAYGASASYTSPTKGEDAHYVRAFIGTQADKLDDAVEAMLVLMNEMPMAREQFEGAKASALKVIASTRVTKENIYWAWDAAQRRGIDYDIRKIGYERIPKITIEDMKAFFDKEIKGRPYHYCVIGKEAALDPAALGKLGPVTRLTKEQLFGYPAE
ncbi:MAG: insulinase family protein [Flavobacteriales bacterium]|nr:insulinase family protein [Flavobacteriales bacterium]